MYVRIILRNFNFSKANLLNFSVDHVYQKQLILNGRSGHVQKHTKNNYLGEINRQKIYQKSF